MRENIGSIPQISRITLGIVGMDAGYYNHSYFWYGVGFLAILSFVFSLLSVLWAIRPKDRLAKIEHAFAVSA